MLEALILSISIASHTVSPIVDLTGANTTTPPAGQAPRKPPKPTRWARPVNGGSCPQNLRQVCLELARSGDRGYTCPNGKIRTTGGCLASPQEFKVAGNPHPSNSCKLRGGRWVNGACEFDFTPNPNPSPSGTRGTGTRFREEMAFKPKPGRGVLNESTAGGSRRPKNQAFYMFSQIG